MAFNVDRLAEGHKQVNDLIENAEFAGYNVINCIVNKRKQHEIAVTQAFGGFETVTSTGVVHKTRVYAYPDKKNNKWLLVIDTEHNRDMIARSYASNMFTVVDKNLNKEIVEICEENGYATEYKAPRRSFEKVSKREEDLEKKIGNKDAELLEMKRKQKALEAEIEKLAAEKEKKTAHREAQDEKVESEVPVLDDETGEVETEVKEVEQQKTVEAPAKANGAAPKKKLSGVKTKRK